MKKRPIDKKIEEKVNIDFSFKEIENQINIEKYEKKKKNKRILFPIFAPVACSLLCFSIIGISLLKENRNNQSPGNGNSEINASMEIEIEDFLSENSNDNSVISEGINTEVETASFITTPEVGVSSSNDDMVVENDIYEKYNGPVIDLVKEGSPYYVSTGPSLYYSLYEVITKGFSLYEVSYLGNVDNRFYCAYVDIDTANEIYEKNKNIPDAETASETNIIDGSIIKWFYFEKYSENLISWYEFSSYENIPRIINEKMVLGVYTFENVCIDSEITTSYDINRTYSYFSSKRFIYESGSYINSNSVDNKKTVWYISLTSVDELNLDKEYFNNFSFNFNDFNVTAEISENTLKFIRKLNLIENAVDEDQIKWNTFVKQAESYKIANEDNLYYYSDIVTLIVDTLK